MSNQIGQGEDRAVQRGLSADIDISQGMMGEAEPWEIWETKLILWSILIGIAGLVVLGILINIFLL